MSSKQQDYSITKLLVDTTKWSGKIAFVFFVIGLILLAITISIAGPQINHYQAEGELKAYQWFDVNNNNGDEVQLLLVTDHQESVEIVLQKIEYENNGQTYNFRNSQNDTVVYRDVFSIIDNELFRNEFLSQGEYRILVNGDPGVEFTLASAHFETGLAVTTAVFLSIFGLTFGLFFTVLPFAICAVIISSLSNRSDRDVRGTDYRGGESSRTHMQQVESQKQQSHSISYQKTSPRKSIVSGTYFQYLTQNDWIGVFIAVVFFILFLTAPNGPFLVFSLIVAVGVVYSVTEREKLKDRVSVLLQMYGEADIEFLASQLDKDEENVIDIIRIMILDDGYPIRMDLVNKVVVKIGKFPEELSSGTLQSFVDTSQEDTSKAEEKSVSQQNIEDDHDEQVETTTTEGPSGEIRDHTVYCSACGEGLKKDVKYCYVCGARQV